VSEIVVKNCERPSATCTWSLWTFRCVHVQWKFSEAIQVVQLPAATSWWPRRAPATLKSKAVIAEPEQLFNTLQTINLYNITSANINVCSHIHGTCADRQSPCNESPVGEHYETGLVQLASSSSWLVSLHHHTDRESSQLYNLKHCPNTGDDAHWQDIVSVYREQS